MNFLDDAWRSAVVEHFGELAGHDVDDLDTEVDISAGSSSFRVAIVGGRVASVEPVEGDAADLSIKVPDDLAVAIATGEMSAAVAYMRGELKVSGDDHRAVLAWLMLEPTDEYQQALARLAEQTTFG